MKTIVAIIFAALLASCAGIPEPAAPPPEWAASPNGVEQVYPNQAFIAQMGRGADRVGAENDALARISRYFSSEIETQQARVRRSLEENDILTTSTERLDETYVRSQTDLFSARYAESWYNKAEGQWQALAYINRDEAWIIYEPRARREADKFITMYAAAGTAEDTLRRYAIYGASLELFEREVASVIFFAEILHPVKAAVSLADVQDALAEIPAAMNEARARSYIYFRCDVDYEGRVLAAAEQALSGLGFPVQKKQAGSVAVCAVTVTENESSQESGGGARMWSFQPSAAITLTGKSGTLLTWNSQPIARVMTATQDVGRRRAYTALAAELEKSFPPFFLEKMGNEFR